MFDEAVELFDLQAGLTELFILGGSHLKVHFPEFNIIHVTEKRRPPLLLSCQTTKSVAYKRIFCKGLSNAP